MSGICVAATLGPVSEFENWDNNIGIVNRRKLQQLDQINRIYVDVISIQFLNIMPISSHPSFTSYDNKSVKVLNEM